MSAGPSEFVKRAITGAVYVALTIGSALLGPWAVFTLFLPVCVIGAGEWHRLHHGVEREGEGGVPTMLLAGCSYVALGLPELWPVWDHRHASALVLGLLMGLAFWSMRSGQRDPARSFAGNLSTVFYIALPFSMVNAMMDKGAHMFIGFMALLWTSDTGAYLVGRAIGRIKLMPSVSPGKTWEGLIGGLALTMAVGWLLSRYWSELSPAQWIACAAAVAVAATLGDLLESAFKRARGVKDSGTILPGHGGILDRFDGFLLASPAMLFAFMLVR